MAFPPNYSQERANRARAKARKALTKQQEREEKSAQRKAERADADPRQETAANREGAE